MSEDPYRFLLRMPQALREELRAAAEDNGRSLNREIVARLEQGLQPGGGRARVRVAVLAGAAALTLSLSAGVAGFVAAGAGSGSPQGERAVVRSQVLGDPAGKFTWVRSGNFDPAARSPRS